MVEVGAESREGREDRAKMSSKVACSFAEPRPISCCRFLPALLRILASEKGSPRCPLARVALINTQCDSPPGKRAWIAHMLSIHWRTSPTTHAPVHLATSVSAALITIHVCSRSRRFTCRSSLESIILEQNAANNEAWFFFAPGRSSRWKFPLRCRFFSRDFFISHRDTRVTVVFNWAAFFRIPAENANWLQLGNYEVSSRSLKGRP